jgi:hypothetical protein
VKALHSPGPWTAEGPDEIFGDYNIHEPGVRAAIGAVVSNLRPPEEVAANARLVVAAPDLLSALGDAIEALAMCEPRTPHGAGCSSRALLAGRAAMAKALGAA